MCGVLLLDVLSVAVPRRESERGYVKENGNGKERGRGKERCLQGKLGRRGKVGKDRGRNTGGYLSLGIFLRPLTQLGSRNWKGDGRAIDIVKLNATRKEREKGRWRRPSDLLLSGFVPSELNNLHLLVHLLPLTTNIISVTILKAFLRWVLEDKLHKEWRQVLGWSVVPHSLHRLGPYLRRNVPLLRENNLDRLNRHRNCQMAP